MMNVVLIIMCILILFLAYSNNSLRKNLDETDQLLYVEFKKSWKNSKKTSANITELSNRIRIIESKTDALNLEITNLKEQIK